MSGRIYAPQKLITKEQIGTFTLKNPEVSVINSVDFMKKLTVAAVSNIVFVRDIFPAAAFSRRQIDGMLVHILRGDDNIPGTSTLVQWMKEAFQAVEKHFLKKMILVIQNSKETLEVYYFNFTYDHEAIRCQLLNELNGKKTMMEEMKLELPTHLKKATQSLLRSLVTLTSTLRPLPDNFEISMQLEFNSNVPDDFELPERFKAVDSLGINLPLSATILNFGKIESKFTTYSISAESMMTTDNDDENKEDNQMEYTMREEHEKDERLYSSKTQVKHTKSTGSSIQVSTQRETGGTKDVDVLSQTISSIHLGEKKVKCICECSDLSNEIQCGSCFMYQHKACYKLLPDVAVKSHICVDCHEPDIINKTCTVPDLITDSNRKNGALYRRALLFCLTSCRISTSSLQANFNLPKATALQIFNQLDKDGCLRPSTGKRCLRNVKTDHLKDNVLNQYFNPPPDSDIALENTEENVFSTRADAMWRQRVFDQENDNENKEDQIEYFMLEEHEQDEVVYSSQSQVEHTNSFVSSLRETGAGKNIVKTIPTIQLREKKVKCICECTDVSNEILCTSCLFYQHKACYKLLGDEPINRHICIDCHEPDTPEKACSVPDLINDTNRKNGALYRRALLFCLTSSKISTHTLQTFFSLPKVTALQIYNRLDIDGCLEASTNKRCMRSIKTDHLKDNVLNLYFTRSSDSNMDLESSQENLLKSDITRADKRKRVSEQGERSASRNDHESQQKRFKYAELKEDSPLQKRI